MILKLTLSKVQQRRQISYDIRYMWDIFLKRTNEQSAKQK